MASSSAKLVLAAGVGLAIGLALGGLGPRAENRLLKARVEALEKAKGGGGLPAGLAGVLNGEVWRDEGSPAPRPSPRPSPSPAEPDEPTPAPSTEADGDDGEVISISFGDDDDDDDVDPAQSIEAAREAMELRQRQAWRALEEQARPSPEQRQTIEDAVGAMNDELVAIASELARSVESGREPERRELMVFAADTLETMIATEDVIYETLGAERAAEVDAEVLDPTAYVDASVLDVLSELQGLDQ
jgi:hypothetical protein